MAYPISAFLARLAGPETTVARGYYTPSTIGQVSQSLSRLAFGSSGGVLLVAEGEQPRAWADLALRGLAVAVQRSVIPAAPAPGNGFVLLGLGAELGYVVVAMPTDPNVEMDETMRLYDTAWSIDPAFVANLMEFAGDSLAPDLLARARVLRNPRDAELLRLGTDVLDFAARQHATLTVSMRALSDRLRNHEDQTRMVVHDMRAPLHTLLISIRAMQRQRFDADGQAELLSVASDSANYLLTLTETILDSARLETSGWALKRQPVKLHTLVNAVCDPLEMATRPGQAALRSAVPEDLPPALMDQGLMERVLTNLVTNAIKYTPPNGEIVVSGEVVHNGHAMKITIADTGYGIPPEAQAHIFDRFYQATENDRRRGTGLGLYFCRLAIEAHGGSIGVQSTVGEGSTFTILLPLTGEG